MVQRLLHFSRRFGILWVVIGSAAPSWLDLPPL